MSEANYTTKLQAGLGMIDETKMLLDLWEPGMGTQALYQRVLESGMFPSMSARRVLNLVAECFAARYLVENGKPASELLRLRDVFKPQELNQVLFVHTCRANAILGDFVREVYWPAYTGGRPSLTREDARDFVLRANDDGLTQKRWAESTVTRVSNYLLGTCADFGLLEDRSTSGRTIKPYRLESRVAVWLAYDLHFRGLGDNTVVGHGDWKLFGLERWDVVEELKRLSRRGSFLVQSAGEVVRVSWNRNAMEEVINGLA